MARVSVSGSGTAGGWESGEGEGSGKEPADEAMCMGRRQSGVLVKEAGVESSARLRFARNELRKAMRRLALACDLVAKHFDRSEHVFEVRPRRRGAINSGRVLHRLGHTYLQMF